MDIIFWGHMLTFFLYEQMLADFCNSYVVKAGTNYCMVVVKAPMTDKFTCSEVRKVQKGQRTGPIVYNLEV